MKTIAILILGAAFYAPIMAAGSAAVGFAADTVQSLNAATERRCDTYNSVLPGACQMP
jgi:outer membrane murein-binding lipoprotein Lpp